MSGAVSVRLDAREVAAFLKVVGPKARTGVKRALRRLGTKVQGTMVKTFRERGVGRHLFGRKATGARKIIRRSRLRETIRDIIQPIKITGFARLQETGGRIRAHKVNHPGATMPRVPFAEPSASKHRGDFRTEIAKEIKKALGG